MACYAVATATAQVAQEQLLRLLTPDSVQEPISAFLRAKFPSATVEHWHADYAGSATVSWSVEAPHHTYSIVFNRTTGQITVTDRSSSAATAETEALATVISAALTRLGGVYFQQLVATFLAPIVTTSQTTSDGALVLRLSL